MGETRFLWRSFTRLLRESSLRFRRRICFRNDVLRPALAGYPRPTSTAGLIDAVGTLGDDPFQGMTLQECEHLFRVLVGYLGNPIRKAISTPSRPAAPTRRSSPNAAEPGS